MAMQIDKILHRLLLNYECVIVPDFGGFIVRESPCNFNTVKDTLKPYSKTVFFNQHLQDNDGLLINAIVSDLNTTYNAASIMVEQWVSSINALVADQGKASVGRIGSFYKGNDNGKWFTPDSSLNLALATYGLRPVNNVAVFETGTPSETQTQPELIVHIDRKPLETFDKPKSSKKAWFAAAAIALAAHIGYLSIEHFTAGKEHTMTANVTGVADTRIDTEQVVPQNDVQVAETPVQSTEAPSEQIIETPVTAEPTAPAVTETPSSVITDQAPIEEKVPVTEVVTPAATTVVAKYRLEQNALNHQRDLMKQHISCYVEMNDNGMYEVIISE